MTTTPPNSPNKGFKDCPVLGVGLGLRHPLLEETLAATPLIDWLEITPENYMGKGGRSHHILERAGEKYPLIPHGVSMSIGSVDPWDETYLNQFQQLAETIQPAWFSDHLCYSGIQGAYFNDLIPLPRTKEAIDHAVKRIRFIQHHFQRPYLVENISFYLQYPQNELADQHFLAEILEQADCGLLLDVNNVYVNSQNHGTDPYEFLNALPLERVVQIHVAGHTKYPEGIVDTHGNPVCDGVWELLEWVLKRSRPSGVLLERDLNLPDFSELEGELKTIRSIWETANPGWIPAKQPEQAQCS
jgi:uncharacterized protein (UPF0276 family)